MKLQNTVNHKAEMNLDNVTKFGIKESIKSFQILSSSLYSDPILAIIRELSTNAYDSHIAAGKPNQPIEIHLPSIFEPYFGVKDYGIGMDENTIETVFTVYFESTKNDNNDEVGGLGIGGKSPYSYTDNFTITSNKDGKKFMYTAFIDDGGLPNIAKLGEVETNETNGVDIQVPVKENDFYYFSQKAAKVFAAFDVPPVFVGDNKTNIERFEFGDPLYKNIYTYSAPYMRGGAFVRMGCILYPLDTDTIANSLELSSDDKMYVDLLNQNIVIAANVGDYDIQPSREGLTYTRENCQLFVEMAKEFGDHLIKTAVDDISQHTNLWEKISKIKEVYNVSPYTIIGKKIIEQTNLEDYIDCKYKSFSGNCRLFDSEVIKDYNIEGYKYSGDNVVSKGNVAALQYDDDITFVFQTKATGIVKRVRDHARQAQNRKDNFVVIRKILTNKELKQFLIAHGIPKKVLMQDELAKVQTPVKSKTPIETFAYNYARRAHCYYAKYTVSRDWKKIEDFDKSSAGEFYYVDSENKSNECIMNKYSGDRDQKASILQYLSGCGIKKVYLPRKDQLKVVRNLDNWININDWLKKHMEEKVFSKENIIKNCLYSRKNKMKYFDNAVIMGYSIHTINKEELVSISGIVRSIARFYEVEQWDNVGNEVDAEINKYISKYPLLAYLYSAPKKEVKQYIEMIDNQKEKEL